MKFKLRKFKKGDEKSLKENINDKEISRMTLSISYPYKIVDANKWIRLKLREYREKKPTKLSFVIDIDGEVAGVISFCKIFYEDKKAEIGYWLGRKYWGKGVMTKAVREIVRIGFKRFKFNRVFAFTFSYNKGSQRVLEKAGFKLEGKLRKNLIKEGKAVDTFVYGRVR